MLQQVKRVFSSDIKTIPAVLDRSYFPVLDGFRGIAILTVIVGHFGIGSKLGDHFKGSIGVGIFYVLSGFLITTLLLKEKLKKGTVSFRKFYIRRSLRILPVSYLYLLVLAIINLLFKLKLSLLSFIACIFYFRNLSFNYGSDYWYNGHFYTLAVEEQFYIFFPVLIVLFLHRYIKLVFGFIILIPILNYLVWNNVGIFYSNYIIHHASLLFVAFFGKDTVCILVGTLLSILIFNQTIPALKKNNYFLSFLLFIAAIVFRNSNIINDEYLSSLIFSIAIAVVIYLCLDANDLLSTILKNPLLIRIGILSYSLYIWQQLFTHYQPWGDMFSYGKSTLLNTIFLFIVAALSYYFFEKRFLALKHKFK